MKWHRAMAASAALTLLVGACGDDDAETASTTTTTAEATSTTETTLAGVETTSVDGLDLPRSVVYAHLEIAVTDVVMSNAVPTTFTDPEPEADATTRAFLTLRLRHEDAYPATNQDLPIDALGLEVGGTSLDPVNTDFGSTLRVEPGTATEHTIAFDVDEDALEDAVLTVATTGSVPAQLPLGGVVPDDPYPMVVPLEGEAAVTLEGGCGDAAGDVSPLEAAFDVDAGSDHDDERVVHAGEPRAQEGERFVRVTVRVVATAQACGAFYGEDTFRLLIDDLPTAPINIFGDQVEVGTGVDVVVGWTVPVDAELELEVGIPDGTTATFPVPTPDLP